MVFTAGLAGLLPLPAAGQRTLRRLVHRKDNRIVELVTRAVVPLIQIFALYVIFHGHYSPGGGFQGGALVAGSVLLGRIVFGHERSQRLFPSVLGMPLGVLGLAVYAGIGVVGMANGGTLLQYDRLPLGLEPDMLRNWGILGVELGVALAVMGTLIAIFDGLSAGGEAETVR